VREAAFSFDTTMLEVQFVARDALSPFVCGRAEWDWEFKGRKRAGGKIFPADNAMFDCEQNAQPLLQCRLRRLHRAAVCSRSATAAQSREIDLRSAG
jgi:hypothetical protein